MNRRTFMSKIHAAVAVSFLAFAPGCTKPLIVDYKDIEIEVRGGKEIFTYKGAPFTGVAREKHKNGNPSKEYPMRDGLIHGIVHEWWENGKLSVETHFENGKRHGLNRYWDTSGVQTKEQVYEHGESKSVKTLQDGVLKEVESPKH